MILYFCVVQNMVSTLKPNLKWNKQAEAVHMCVGAIHTKFGQDGIYPW